MNRPVPQKPQSKRKKIYSTDDTIMYFDLLAKDELSNVVRNLRALPRVKNWATYIPATHLSSLSDVRNELGFFVSTLSTGYVVGDINRLKKPPNGQHLFSLSTHISCVSRVSSSELILKTHQRCRNIIIYYIMFSDMLLMNVLEQLSLRCRDTRALSIHLIDDFRPHTYGTGDDDDDDHLFCPPPAGGAKYNKSRLD